MRWHGDKKLEMAKIQKDRQRAKQENLHVVEGATNGCIPQKHPAGVSQFNLACEQAVFPPDFDSIEWT